MHKNEMPGEFTLGVLFGTIPDPAGFLTEPFLDSQGRAACKSGLKKALAAVGPLQGQFDDGGRLGRISRCLTVMLHLLTTVMMVKGEGWAE